MLPWRRHDGSPGRTDADYRVPPDPRIGAVRSAETNRTHAGWIADERLAARMAVAGFVALMLAAVIGAAVVIVTGPFDAPPWTTPDGVAHLVLAGAAALAAGLACGLAP